MTKRKTIPYFSLIIMLLLYIYTGIVTAIPYDITLANIKASDINVLSDSVVVPGGQTIGVRINTNGLTVLNLEEFESIDSKMVRPYENVDIRNGDVIQKINNESIESVEDFIDKIQKSNGEEITLLIFRGDEEHEVTMVPEIDKYDEVYKLGLWVREMTSGVGTLTFIDPISLKFGALGHGISNINGAGLIDIKEGTAYGSVVLSVTRGRKGSPGELKGAINENDEFGTITQNTVTGIYGTVDKNEFDEEKLMQIGSMQEVEVGPASILSNVTGSEVKEYEIYIDRIYRKEYGTKSMLIRVTDDELIASTGGIVQGMSGSPIIQNGKIVGAVTHVLVNDPTKGYGIFIETMLKEMNDE
ncbi:MAG: SpoIVB peptidase [Clostridia bacterium]|nr:SpoIVB peptidase [Clostridia bacterium]